MSFRDPRLNQQLKEMKKQWEMPWDYKKSKAYKVRRALKIRATGYRCQKCGSNGVLDLVKTTVLCKPCKEIVNAGRAKTKEREKKGITGKDGGIVRAAAATYLRGKYGQGASC